MRYDQVQAARAARGADSAWYRGMYGRNSDRPTTLHTTLDRPAAARGRPATRPLTAAAAPGPYGAEPSYASAKAEALADARHRLHVSTPHGRVEMARAVRALDREQKYADVTAAVPAKVRLAFAAFDANRSGFLDYKELRKALRHYGLDCSSRESARVLAAYDDSPNGRMDLWGEASSDPDPPSRQDRCPRAPDRSLVDAPPCVHVRHHTEFHRLVADLTRGVIRSAAAPSYDYSRIPQRVRRAFSAFDANRSGYLDVRELRNALRHYGIDASARGAARVLASYDRHPDGRLDLAEFAQLVSDLDAGQMRATRERVPARAREAFVRYDANGDGYLSARELRGALHHYGLDVSSREAAQILAAYDDTPDRRLDVVEFSALVQDLELGLLRAAERPGTPYHAPARPSSAHRHRRDVALAYTDDVDDDPFPPPPPYDEDEDDDDESVLNGPGAWRRRRERMREDLMTARDRDLELGRCVGCLVLERPPLRVRLHSRLRARALSPRSAFVKSSAHGGQRRAAACDAAVGSVLPSGRTPRGVGARASAHRFLVCRIHGAHTSAADVA